MSLPVATRRTWVEPSLDYSVRRQCGLADVPRSSFYYEAAGETEQNRLLMRLIDEQYMKHPEFGYPRMTEWLVNDEGHEVNHKRIARLMQKMGLQAITPEPHTSKPAPGHKIYPYLLSKVEIERVNHVWSTDITYIPMKHGFMYLAAVIDWHSRYVLSWELSNTMENLFCVDALEGALRRGRPEILNGSRGAVHVGGLHGRAAGRGDSDQHGWAREGIGQRLHRATVVDGEVRERIPKRLRRWTRVASRVEAIF